jgi:NADPH:quinone reductase-like Zn-dependent oxidoreductase
LLQPIIQAAALEGAVIFEWPPLSVEIGHPQKLKDKRKILMKAIVYTKYGSPQVLGLKDIDRPVPNDNEVLVKISASSINAQEWHFMRGKPYIMRLAGTGLLKPKDVRLGADLAGVIEAVGSNVTEFKPGDEVFGVRWGAFAEYVNSSGKGLVLKPANVTFEQAAAVPVAALTALQGLRDKGKIQAGHKVLVNGAGGGVGTFAVQIAKAFGAEVTGVTNTGNVGMVRSIGADHVIDYTKQDYTQGGERYDLIFDLGGNHSLSERLRVLATKGTLVMAGSISTGNWLGPLASMLKTVLVAPFVSQKLASFLAKVNKEDLHFIKEMLETGKIIPVIDRTFPLSEVPEAIRYVEEGHTRGKVVITV